MTAVGVEDILELMGATKSWTDARRRIVAKTLFDIVKLEIAAILASKFLTDFDIRVKIAVVVVTLVTAGAAFSLYPTEGD